MTNTCFMNAGLQCLLHTTELSHHFLRGFFKTDMNRENPLGCKGKLAESFHLLVDQAHTHSRSWTIPRDYYGYQRNTMTPHYVWRRIGRFNAHFDNLDQHDSQELIGFLLDGIHEDLNRVRQKPYVENVVGDGTNDTAIAHEAWDRYKKRNDSFVVDTFQGQMRSRVTCSECKNMSVSFDPSMYVGVAFKKLVAVKRWKCAVKFSEPTAARVVDHDHDAVDFSDTEKVPEGFCFDCVVDVTVKEGDTYGSLVKLFEERCPGRRFIALTWTHTYYVKGFKEFLQARAQLPEKNVDTCVVLEAPAVVADGWWEMSGPAAFAVDSAPSTAEPESSAAAPAAASQADVAVPKTAVWHDAAGPDKPGLSAMVNLGCLHVAGTNSTFLRFGLEEIDYSSYSAWHGYKKFTKFVYPVDLQRRVVESSTLMPVLVFLRKTKRGKVHLIQSCC
jgi:hypothetical protein